MFSPGETYFQEEVATTRTSTPSSTPTPTPTSTAGNSPASTTSSATTAEKHSHALGPGPIAGIAIGGTFVLVLIAILLYMCGRQKTLNEILHRHSQAPVSTYQPTAMGVSEAQYPNISKGMHSSMMRSSHGSNGPYTETDGSYRSASPPIDERTGMITNLNAINPAAWQGIRDQTIISSQGSPNSNTGVFPSPQYYDTDGLHTHDTSALKYVISPLSSEARTNDLLRPYPLYVAAPSSHPSQDSTLHELPVPSRQPSTTTNLAGPPTPQRPFSFTASESGYRGPG